MAGRPKRRAAQIAEQVGAPPAEPAQDWAAEVAKMLGVESPAPQPPPTQTPTQARAEVTRELQQLDRRSLSEWWRDQAEHLEADYQDRIAALANSGDHPSEIYAAEVRKFGTLGMPTDLLALLLHISEGELVAHYGDDYRIGEGMLISHMAANLFRIGTSGNDRVAVKALVELANRRGGEPWRPPAQKIELDDGRKTKSNLIDSSKLTYEERQALRAMIARVVADREVGGVSGAVVAYAPRNEEQALEDDP